MIRLLCKLVGHRWCNRDEIGPRYCERCGYVDAVVPPDDEVEREAAERP